MVKRACNPKHVWQRKKRKAGGQGGKGIRWAGDKYCRVQARKIRTSPIGDQGQPLCPPPQRKTGKFKGTPHARRKKSVVLVGKGFEAGGSGWRESLKNMKKVPARDFNLHKKRKNAGLHAFLGDPSPRKIENP